MLPRNLAEFSKMVKNIEARTKKLYCILIIKNATKLHGEKSSALKG